MSYDSSCWEVSLLNVTADIVFQMLDSLAELSCRNELPDYMYKCRYFVYHEISMEITRQLSMKNPNSPLSPEDLVLAQKSFREHVCNAFNALWTEIEKETNPTEATLYQSPAMVRLILDVPIIFGCMKPEHEGDFEEEYQDEEVEEEEEAEMEDDIPEHVATHDFERYDDNDWYSHEYELNTDLEDVLLGPDYAKVDEISDLAPAKECSDCVLCGDGDVEMRKIKVCGHEFCAECLETQLGTDHECRYRCSLCKADFFTRDTAA